MKKITLKQFIKIVLDGERESAQEIADYNEEEVETILPNESEIKDLEDLEGVMCELGYDVEEAYRIMLSYFVDFET